MALLVLPRDLTGVPAGTVNVNSALIVDDGSGVYKATPEEVTNAGSPINSQAEAEAGIVNTGRMTPLRVKQAISALGVSQAVLASSVGAGMVGAQVTGAGSAERRVIDFLRDQPVSILNFYAPGDGTDYAPALARAIDAGHSSIFYPAGPAYRHESVQTITVTRPLTIDFNGQLIVNDGGKIELKAPIVASGRTLTADSARYAGSFALDNAADIEPGDIVNIQSNATPLSGWSDRKVDTLTVRGVTGNTIATSQTANFAWEAAEAGLSVTVWRPQTVTTRNANFLSTQVDGETDADVFIYFEGLSSITHQCPKFAGSLPYDRENNIYRRGFIHYYCIGINIISPDYYAMAYPMGAYGGSRQITETSARARYCHSAHLDIGGFGGDYKLIGLDAAESFAALNAHPSFRVYVTDFQVAKSEAPPSMRSIGTTIGAGSYQNIEAADTTPQYQHSPPSAGFEYIYADADCIIDGFQIDSPNRTTADIYVRYGRKAYIANTRCVDIRVGDNGAVSEVEIGPGVVTRNGARSPSKALISTQEARVSVPPMLPAYLDSAIYHIDPYSRIVDQSDFWLEAYGPIARKLGASTIACRLHVRPFTAAASLILTGKLTIRAVMQHESNGLFSSIEQDYDFGCAMGGGAVVVLPATPVATRGPSNSDTYAVSLALANPTVFGGTDGYIGFDLTVGASGAPSNPKFSLSYRLELVDTAS